MRHAKSSKAGRYQQLDAHIGQGTYGKVEKARDTIDKEIVAIKKVKVDGSHVLDTDYKDEEILTSDRRVTSVGIHFTVLREMKVMRELNHINIISIKDVYVEGDFINLVMPYMVSDLRKLVEKRIRLNEAQIKNIMYQIILGVHELHQNWFIHRDLAPANIFIDSEGICKVADFGLSESFGSPRPAERTPKVVTLWYRAPELLYGAAYYQTKIDVWSIGCIFGELLQSGKPLFPGQGEIDQLGRIFELLGTPTKENWPEVACLPYYFEFHPSEPKSFYSVFPNASETSIDLLQKMLTLNPMQRISTTEALKHPFFLTEPLACSPRDLPLSVLLA